jgi:hypothetical protein
VKTKKKADDAITVPGSPEAEIAVLGAIFLDSTLGAFHQVAELLRPEDFSLDSHKRIYRAIVELVEENAPIDFNTVTGQLKKHNHLDLVGGHVYVCSLTDGLPRVANVSHYARTVKETALRRFWIIAGEKMIAEASRADASPEDLFRLAEDHLSRIRKVSTAKPKIDGVGDGAELLDAVAAFVRRYVFLSAAQTDAVVLWIAHTHAFLAAECTPYLSVTSAEKRCGKTRLLEVMELLVNQPWLTARTSAAALVRKVDAEGSTLLLDETDAAFKSGDEYSEALRGILNAGHRRGGSYTVVTGKGENMEAKDFSVFGPKAIAGIGRLPDTVADRSIPIRLKRKSVGEPVIRFRHRKVRAEATALRSRLAAWAHSHLEDLRNAEPDLPVELSDRAQDGAEPLLAIADATGNTWAVRARRALIELCTGTAGEDQSLRTELLIDIRTIFEDQCVDAMASEELVAALNGLQDHPWCEFSNGKSLTQRTLAKLLKPFDIGPTVVRIGDRTPRGYPKIAFQDAWSRYLDVSEVQQAQHSNKSNDLGPISQVQQSPNVADRKSEESSIKTRVVALVADKKPVADNYEIEERAAIEVEGRCAASSNP